MRLIVMFASILIGSLWATDSHQEKLQGYLGSLVKSNEPGFAIGVISKGEFVFQAGYGLANLKTGKKITTDTVFRIASTSKQFTAAAVQILANEGRFSLNDSVRKHFPEFQSFTEKMKIHQLIHHTSGWIDYGDLADDAGHNMESYYTPEDIMNWLEKEESGVFEPGEQFEYCNTGYFLLSQLVLRLTDKSLNEFAKEKIFAPLGMSQTFFYEVGHPGLNGRAIGYQKLESGFRVSMTSAPIVGDGGLMTTVQELKNWDDAYYKETPFPQSFWKQMITPGKLNSGKELDYANGLGVEKYKGYTLISHSGSYVGFRAELLRFVEPKLSVIILANRDDLEVTEIAMKVAESYLPKAKLAPKKPDFSQLIK